jgi:hypothetical protein
MATVYNGWCCCLYGDVLFLLSSVRFYGFYRMNDMSTKYLDNIFRLNEWMCVAVINEWLRDALASRVRSVRSTQFTW